MTGHTIFLYILLASNMVYHSVATEESCSKFSYEKEIISNMLKMELKVEKMEQDIKERNKDILKLLEAQRKDMEKFAKDYKNLRDILLVVMENKTAEVNSVLDGMETNIAYVLEERIAELEVALNNVTKKLDGAMKEYVGKNQSAFVVAFSAVAIQHQVKLAAHKIIIFESLLTNIGKAYNPKTGQFIAPVAGIYVFTCSLLSASNGEFWAYIAVNKSGKVYFNERGTGGRHGMASQTFVAQLNPGDVVTVNTKYGSMISGGQYSSFSGYLLR